jgi:protein MpaA
MSLTYARRTALVMFLFLEVGCGRTMRGKPAAAVGADARTETIGSSVHGRDLVVHFFDGGQTKAQRPILILAAVHGNEGTTAALARRFVDHLREHPGDLAGQNVAVLCVANPDGLAAGARVNANGVDINRNFPSANWKAGVRRTQYFNGTAAASEPETRAIMTLIQTLRPIRICSIHSIDKNRQQNNYDGPGEDVARAMGRRNGYPVTPTIGYATPGSFGSWAGVDQQIPTITLELPRSASAEKAWEENREALVAFVRGE